MRITIVLNDNRLAIDVRAGDKVKTLKEMVHERILIQTVEDKKIGKYLEMKFGGAALQDEWVLQDIAITSGSVVKCALKTVEKPKLIVHLAYNHENVSITDDMNLITTTVGKIKSILSERLGIPISIFHLSCETRNCEPEEFPERLPKLQTKLTKKCKRTEMYDTNTLDFYGLEIGSTIKLDLWDGWMELILAALVGHENIVAQHFSWDRLVRQFQQKAALYIASYFGHMGLATAMMKYGCKPYEAIGTHPTRKWCQETEHEEALKSPLHVACTRGHLPIIRMFVKSSPLCFITKDEQGRIPIQIALHHRHRACFEYLLARQWGRKTGKDVSFPITIYCRILQWCERAKARVLLMHGTGKSTFKGVPPKNGALVGSGLLVDGFSSKPANSIPFALIPKPPISPESMLYAVAFTKRKVRSMRRRQSSSIKSPMIHNSSVVSVSSLLMKDRQQSAGTSVSNQSISSLMKSDTTYDEPRSVAYSYKKEVLSNGNMRSLQKYFQNSQSKNIGLESSIAPKIGGKANLDKVDSYLSNLITLPANDKQKPRENATILQLNKSNRYLSKASKISFKQKTKDSKKSNGNQISLTSRPSSAVKRSFTSFNPVIVPEAGIPLPAKSLESQMKPFFYWSSYQEGSDPVKDTMQKYECYRGQSPRQHAVQCLAVTSAFTEKPWLQQVRMATCLTRRGVKKQIYLLSNAQDVVVS